MIFPTLDSIYCTTPPIYRREAELCNTILLIFFFMYRKQGLKPLIANKSFLNVGRSFRSLFKNLLSSSKIFGPLRYDVTGWVRDRVMDCLKFLSCYSQLKMKYQVLSHLYYDVLSLWIISLSLCSFFEIHYSKFSFPELFSCLSCL